ncbi:MAG: hypothetical protein ABFD50_06140 [Smithella sp.]
MKKFGYSACGSEQTLIVLANNDMTNEEVASALQDLVQSIKDGIYDYEN